MRYEKVRRDIQAAPLKIKDKNPYMQMAVKMAMQFSIHTGYLA